MLRANSCVAKEAACKFLKKIILTLEAFVSALSSNACSLFLCWFNSFCSSTDSDRGELLSKLKLCIVFHTKALFYITRSQLGCPASSQSCTGSREAFQQMVPFGSQLLQMRSWQLSSREIQLSQRGAMQGRVSPFLAFHRQHFDKRGTDCCDVIFIHIRIKVWNKICFLIS